MRKLQKMERGVREKQTLRRLQKMERGGLGQKPQYDSGQNGGGGARVVVAYKILVPDGLKKLVLAPP
jgi:hypothetical protein